MWQSGRTRQDYAIAVISIKIKTFIGAVWSFGCQTAELAMAALHQYRAIALILLAVCLSAVSCWPLDSPGTVPEQIHLAFGSTTNDIVVVWSTPADVTASGASAPHVRYGVTNMSQVAASEQWQFTEGNPDGVQWFYRAKLLVRKSISKIKMQYYMTCTCTSYSDLWTCIRRA